MQYDTLHMGRSSIDLYSNDIGAPEDVAAAIVFLASPEAAWTTGIVVDVAGGITAM